MSELVKFPGSGVSVRPTKKAGNALISATLGPLHLPLNVAGRCRDELRGTLRKVREGQRYYLSDAKFNHERMLSRAVIVAAAHRALFPIIYPNMVASPTLSREDALMMLAVLFGTLGKKSTDNETLIRACVEMLSPESDIIGEATELWMPVSRHPVVLALAIKKLMYNSVFTSVAELRTAMQEARSSILWLTRDVERWTELLQTSDRVLFEFDRAAWQAAYANVGADVIRELQDSDEQPYRGYGDDDPDQPGSPRWCAQEAMRLRIEGE